VAEFHGAGLHGIEHLQRGTISPAAKARIWNLPSVISPTRFATSSAPPNSVSRLFASSREAPLELGSPRSAAPALAPP